jgi:hypothetical protein
VAESKGKKLRRSSKHKTMYELQRHTTETNRKKKLGARIRSNPNDLMAIARYEQTYGPAQVHLQSLTGKGQWLAKQAA